MINLHNNSQELEFKYQLPISKLENTDSSIVYEIPAGKPNPHQTCALSEDNRDRVKQSAYKSNTCSYYVMNFLRRRIGEKPCQELIKDREVEKICSSRRKAQTKHQASLPTLAHILGSVEGLKTLGALDLKKVQYLVENKAILQPKMETEETLQGCPSLFPFLEEFIKEGKCKDMHEFLLKKKYEGLNQINEELLSKFGTSSKEMFETEMCQKSQFEKTDFDTLDIVRKASFSDFFAREISAKAYGLHTSCWTPVKGIDELILELKNKGPLFVGGQLGKPAYSEPPFKMKKGIADREIYAWKPNAKRNDSGIVGHAVLLVGAKKINDVGYVYLIDPQDPSDPQDRSKQKIYMISFNNLASNIADLHGKIMKNSSLPYAYYGNFKL